MGLIILAVSGQVGAQTEERVVEICARATYNDKGGAG